jgi:hypothetical protein
VKKWGIAILVIAVVAVLYIIELSKISTQPDNELLNLDELEISEADRQWDAFYKVRAKLIDGQTAEFTIPRELLRMEGKEMELTGAAVFFGNGCRAAGDKVAVSSIFLLPTLGLANACVHLPEVAMRWTIIVSFKEEWLVTREDMINAMVRVKGLFRIDTAKPYDAAFYIDDASVSLVTETEGAF